MYVSQHGAALKKRIYLRLSVTMKAVLPERVYVCTTLQTKTLCTDSLNIQ